MSLTKRSSYKTLQDYAKTPPNLGKIITPERVKSYQIKQEDWCLSYASTQVDEPIMDALQALSDDVGTVSRYQRLLEGEHVNLSENKAVTHHHTRHKDKGGSGEEFTRMMAFCEEIRQHKRCSYNHTPFKHVIQVGIGGSCLGPKAIYEALRHGKNNEGQELSLNFLSSIDTVELETVLDGIDWASTLFIVASKSGTTQETMMNMEQIFNKAEFAGVSRNDIQQNSVSITTQGSPLDQQSWLDSFYIDEGVGGRFSVTSSIGTLGLTLAVGPKKVTDFLRGAAKMDAASINPSMQENIALCYALLGIWEQHFLGYQGRLIVPYAYALRYFPEHIKQVWCESLGKRCDLEGNSLQMNTSPIVSGGLGTDSQHATFQHAHQGNPVIPIHFIGRIQQDALNTHMIAQIVALATGEDSSHGKKEFPGNRPSTLLLGNNLSPDAVGQLVSVYENMVMFQSFIWDINAFDQPGVELGKSLTKKIMSNTYNKNSILSSFLDLIH